MSDDNKLLLNAEAIELKIQRLNFELAEKYFHLNELYVFGIEGQGFILAERITKQLEKLIQVNIHLNKISINKENPIGSVRINPPITHQLHNKHLLLVDDVLNSGKTLFYAMQLFVSIPLASLKVLVLVNRSHLQFPVYPDFIGMTLSTTYQNHIKAHLNNKKTSKVILQNK